MGSVVPFHEIPLKRRWLILLYTEKQGWVRTIAKCISFSSERPRTVGKAPVKGISETGNVET